MNWSNNNTMVNVGCYRLPCETLEAVKKVFLLLDKKKTLDVWYYNKYTEHANIVSQITEICKNYDADIILHDTGSRLLMVLQDAAYYTDLHESQYAVA